MSYARLVLAIVLILAFAGRVPRIQAQASPPPSCRDAHRFPVCGSYFLFEIIGTDRLAGTKTLQPGCPPTSTSRACLRRDFQSYLAADIGRMHSTDGTHASGVSVQLGGSDDGGRVAFRARRRWWVSDRTVIDGGIGPLAAQQRDGSTAGSRWVYGATAQLGVGRSRIGVVTGGMDVASSRASVHAGLAVESQGMILAGLGILGAGIALVSGIAQAR
jgi:hypothetical protein